MKHYLIKSAVPAILGLALIGCSTTGKQANSYESQAKSVPPTKVPAGMNTKSMQNYYPIPSTASQATGTNPSIVPPGSQAVQQSPASQAPAQSKAATMSGNSLVINNSYDQAWGKVGSALQSSGYKILQQDKGLGAYYVLDTAGSGGTLKVNTPIYQVHLKSAGNVTEVNVYNDQNQAAPGAVSGRILSAIKQNAGN
ncbi:MAG: outer membrane protein assembly factor BamC [Coxiellaceae bacterium]|nr:MAG: outer membrane protein assembly factor BamC [Coxiellaceae bacterium]